MTLPFLEQQFQNVEFELRGPRQRHLVRSRHAGERSSHSQFGSPLDWDNVGDRCIPIENCKGFAALNAAKELA